MNISQIPNKIISSDEKVCTESVAEHIYGMQVVANYFLPLEDLDGKLDLGEVFRLSLGMMLTKLKLAIFWRI